jgi:8-hydroxy-5-deazaflavin:NADPH oxidoreductase
MKIGVLGTGSVGTTLAGKLASLGHEVKMGARDAGNEKAAAWAAAAGAKASHGTFADAATFGEIVFNCTSGAASLDALAAAGAENLRGKVLVDVANPLDVSHGMPPSLFTGSNDSLGERIQKAFPQARVVKSLNTVNANVMVEPGKLPWPTDVFVCGNDASAKADVAKLLNEFGWKFVVDLGDITAARGTEAYLLLWLRLWGTFQTPHVNIHVVH